MRCEIALRSNVSSHACHFSNAFTVPFFGSLSFSFLAGNSLRKVGFTLETFPRLFLPQVHFRTPLFVASVKFSRIKRIDKSFFKGMSGAVVWRILQRAWGQVLEKKKAKLSANFVKLFKVILTTFVKIELENSLIDDVRVFKIEILLRSHCSLYYLTSYNTSWKKKVLNKES